MIFEHKLSFQGFDILKMYSIRHAFAIRILEKATSSCAKGNGNSAGYFLRLKDMNDKKNSWENFWILS
ncbi:UNVERIFIED_CONTAM: hypothetical protein NCL1_11650 [Trichonephila clavipes]